MMLCDPFLFTFLFAWLALMTTIQLVDAITGIVQIQNIQDFAFSAEGDTTITVNYQMDGTVTFGTAEGGNNFYVHQSLQGPDCTSDDNRDYLTAFTDKEPDSYSASTTVTTLARGSVPFPQGETSFCLRVKLMLDMIDTIDQPWQQVDFQFTVTVNYPAGSATALYSANENYGQANSELSGGSQADTSSTPVIAATLEAPSSSFRYGDSIPIVVEVQTTLNVFDYSVQTDNVFLSESGSSDPLTIQGSEVLPTIADYQPDFNFNSGTVGSLSVELPLIIYQSNAVNGVQVNVPVGWSYNNARRLQTGSGVYTGPSSGVGNGVVELKLEPYTDKSGAVVGYTVTSVVSSVCLGAATLLL